MSVENNIQNSVFNQDTSSLEHSISHLHQTISHLHHTISHLEHTMVQLTEEDVFGELARGLIKYYH